MIYIGWILFFSGVVRLIVSFVNWWSQPYLPLGKLPAVRPRLSVLIPARNEEENIYILLNQITSWKYRPLEVLIYDDQSSDRTGDVVRKFAFRYPYIRLIKGKKLPDGWLGKNYACDQLAQAARGRKFLFLDADVKVGKDLPERMVSYMDRNKLELLSVFPHQIMDCLGTLLSVPLMNWILLTLLPLPLVRLMKQPSLSAANGQCMMFNSFTYWRCRPHRRFRNNAVEDMAIVEAFKQEELPVATLLGRDDISCCMYSSLQEAMEGFSKNIFRFFGGKKSLAFLFAIITSIAPVYLFYFNGRESGITYLVILLFIQFFVSRASRQSFLANIFLLIPRQIVLWGILIGAYYKQKKKYLTWKDRNISSVSC